MRLKSRLVLSLAVVALLAISWSVAEAVSVTPKFLSGEMRIVYPDGKSISVNQAGGTFNLEANSRIEVISGYVTLQIAGYLVKIQKGGSVILRPASKTSEIILGVLTGDIVIESSQQAWLLTQGEAALLPVSPSVVVSGEEGDTTVASKSVESEASGKETTGESVAMTDQTFTAGGPLIRLAAPITIVVNTPIPSPQPVKYASPWAP